MKVWRLMAHHEFPERAAQWSQREGVLAIGWGETGDLNKQRFSTQDDLVQIVKRSHSNSSNGGRSLWRLHQEIGIGDSVILSANGRRVAVFRVTSEYSYVGGEYPIYYEHRRKAELLPIDPDRLWHLAGGMASGQSVYQTLVCCDRSLADDDLLPLMGK